jgi:Cu(I)/Ag(I) efflux system periplasmic protein CusF
MNATRYFLVAAAIGSLAAFAGVAHAQAPSGHDHHAAAPAAQGANAEMSEGEVRKVDKQGKKITLKHGPLKNLDMPSMTMSFQVADAAMLDKLKVGDKVRFVATNAGGKFTATEIQPVK